MASLTITIDDAKLPRWLAAYGVANNAQLKAAIIERVREPVVHYELSAAQQIADAAVVATQVAQRASLVATKQTIDTEITVT